MRDGWSGRVCVGELVSVWSSVGAICPRYHVRCRVVDKRCVEMSIRCQHVVINSETIRNRSALFRISALEYPPPVCRPATKQCDTHT